MPIESSGGKKMKNLKRIRNAQGKTQLQVQIALKIDQTALSKYETGDRVPSVDHLLKLARYYGTSVDYLLDLTDEPTPYPPKKAEG